MTWMEFLTVLIVAFAAVMILAGIFAALMGNGKAKYAGVAMLIVGAVVGVVWLWLIHGFGSDPILLNNNGLRIEVWNTIWNGLCNLIAVLVGALVGVVVFLVAILKS